MCSEATVAVSYRAMLKRMGTTDGMADSRSLTVRSGIITSFCATTLVTPSFVAVFMAGMMEREKETERRKKKRTYEAFTALHNRHRLSGEEREKIARTNMF
jgi:hypothetical protein